MEFLESGRLLFEIAYGTSLSPPPLWVGTPLLREIFLAPPEGGLDLVTNRQGAI